MRPRVQKVPEEAVKDLGPPGEAPTKRDAPEMRRERGVVGDDEGQEPADEDDRRGDQRGARGARLGASPLRGPYWVCHGTPPFNDSLSPSLDALGAKRAGR